MTAAFRRTDFWLLEDDLRAFAARVASVLPAAWWMCSRPGPFALHQVHAHGFLGEALDCGGGVQAFLPLPAGAEPPPGAVIGAGVRPEPGLEVLAMVTFRPTVRRPADLFGPGHLQAGRLSVRWDPAQTGPQQHEVLGGQVDQVWAVLDEVTLPVVTVEQACPEGRIGAKTRERVLAERCSLSLSGRDRFPICE